MNRKVQIKLTPIVFTLVMVIGFISALTLPAKAVGYVYDISKGNITIAASTSADNVGGYAVTYGGLTEPEQVPKDTPVTIKDSTSPGSTNGNVVTVSGVAITVILDNVTIDRSSASSSSTSDPCAFLLKNNANVTLDQRGICTLKSGYHAAGLQVSTGNTLTIAGTGTLNASACSNGSTSSGAGIGGSYISVMNDSDYYPSYPYSSAGTIIIKSGTVHAEAAMNSAGVGGSIGGNGGGNGGNITIQDNAIVTAKGGENGAGIGCGVYNGSSVNGGNITIQGSANVTATGGKGSAGIGGGGQSCGGTINILGGTVTAIGGVSGDTWGAGPGIGSAMNSSGTDSITIGSAANVVAVSPGTFDSCTDAIRSISNKFTGTALMVSFASQQTAKTLTIKNGTTDIGTVSPVYKSVAFTAAAGNTYHLYAGGEMVLQSDDTEGFAVSGTGLKSYTDVYYKYTVSFDPNGGTGDVSSQSVKPGTQAIEPTQKPTRVGYTFSGWYSGKAATTKFNFSNGITNAITLYAGWSLAVPSIGSSPEAMTGKTYADGVSYTLSVSASHTLSTATFSYQWYKEATPGTANPSSDMKVGTDSSSLTVSNVSDSGYYYCVVTASVGGKSASAQSGAARVAIANTEQVDITDDIIITFSDAVSDDGGTLSGVTTDMEYSVDGGTNWTVCGSASFAVTGVSASSDILVRYAPKANYNASSARTVDVSQAAVPEVTGVDPTEIGGKGRIAGADTTMEYKRSTDSSWISITHELLTDSSLSNLATETTYDIRVKASGEVLASPAKEITINRYDAPREDTPSPSIDYITEKLTGLTADADYLINSAASTADADGNIGIDGSWFGNTVDIIKQGDYTTTDDSLAQSLSVAARPDTPQAAKAALDYSDETISYDSATYEVYSAETGGIEIADKGSITGYVPAAGSSCNVYIRVKATNTTFASEWTAVTIPARAVTPAASVVAIKYGTETINFDSKYEVFSAVSGGAVIADAGSIHDYIPAAGSPAANIFVRTKATSSGFVSEWQSVILPARPAAPSAPTLSTKADTTVTLGSAGSGIEYKCGAGTWQDHTDFSGLAQGTEYQFLERVEATGLSFASLVSPALSVTTKTNAAGAPSAPVVSEQRVDSISVDAKKDYQYAITTADTKPAEEKYGPLTAEDGTKEFSGLSAATQYFVWVRVAETDDAMASNASRTGIYTAASAPASSVVSIDYDMETISYGSSYEVSTAQTDGEAIASGGSIESCIPPAGSPSADSVYVRVKASGSVPASEWTAVTIPTRPAAPSAPTLSTKADTTVTLGSAGSGIEYKCGAGTWQDEVGFSGLAQGTEYQFLERVEATGLSFASLVSPALSVTTKTNAAGAPSAPVVSEQRVDSISVDTKKDYQYAITTADTKPAEEKYGPLTAEDGTKEFSGLNPATQYFVWTRVAETDDAMASDASRTGMYTAAAAPASSVVSIDYDMETISYGSSYEVSTAQTDGEAIASGGSIESCIPPAGSPSADSVYVRVKASGSVPASEWTAVTIPVRPAAPAVSAVTIDYAKETIVYASTYAVFSAQTGGAAIADQGSIKTYIPDAGKPAGILYVRVKAVSGESFRSVWQSLSLPARPDTPADTTVKTRSDTEVDLNMAAGLEYSRDGENWQDTGSFEKLTQNMPYTFFTRMKAVIGASFASANGKSITVMTKASAADARDKPVLSSKTTGSIKVTAIFGQEYSIDDGATWKDGGATWKDGVEFTELTSNTEYKVITRVKETDTAMPSKRSEALTVKTDIAFADSTDNTNITVNGKTLAAGTTKTSTTESGRRVETVTVDSGKLENILASSGTGATVTIPIMGNSDVASGVLTGEMVKSMETKAATLVVQTNSGSYTLPASAINIGAIPQQFGTSISLSDISVTVSVAEPSASMTQVVENAAQDGGFTIMVPAVNYTVTCTHGGQTVNVSSFNAYVERTIAIPDGVDPAKITTGVVIDPDGTTHPVPTRVTVMNGKYYAVINSLTNSTYSVVWNPLEFSDVTNHWAKNAINDMGSRMVVTGVGNNNFAPGRNMTRAEFATIIVRALGLEPGTGASGFHDVNTADWYCGFIKTAASYGIIKGYSNGNFGPNDAITREEAMTMIAKAMTITKLSAGLTDSETNQLLSAFSDGGSASSYAKGSIAACLKTGISTGTSGVTISPKAKITRAEVAVMVQRLLQKSKLI